MPKSVFAVLAFFALGVACASPPETSNQRNNSDTAKNELRSESNASPMDEKPLEPLPQQPDPSKISKIDYFGSAELIRNLSTKNELGKMIPTYDSAAVSGSLDKPPQVGEKVVIIPLINGIEPFLLAIRSSEMKSFGCSEENEKEYWEVNFDPIKSQNILADPQEGRRGEFPFDIFMIYPAVDFAKKVPASDLQAQDLPSRIVAQVIHAAIDLDADGKPDLLEAIYCCSKPTKPREECDLTCTKTFRKTAGKWKLIEEHQPC